MFLYKTKANGVGLALCNVEEKGIFTCIGGARLPLSPAHAVIGDARADAHY